LELRDRFNHFGAPAGQTLNRNGIAVANKQVHSGAELMARYIQFCKLICHLLGVSRSRTPA
jgi:hypothetical protein